MPASLGKAASQHLLSAGAIAAVLTAAASQGLVAAQELVAHMSDLTYAKIMRSSDKPLVWLHGEVKSPPFSPAARLEAGFFLRQLQCGESLSLPHSRPMPSIGPHCYELRINDATGTWRIIYRIDPDAIIIVEVFEKKTPQTPRRVIESCQQRLRRYDTLAI